MDGRMDEEEAQVQGCGASPGGQTQEAIIASLIDTPTSVTETVASTLTCFHRDPALVSDVGRHVHRCPPSIRSEATAHRQRPPPLLASRARDGQREGGCADVRKAPPPLRGSANHDAGCLLHGSPA